MQARENDGRARTLSRLLGALCVTLSSGLGGCGGTSCSGCTSTPAPLQPEPQAQRPLAEPNDAASHDASAPPATSASPETAARESATPGTDPACDRLRERRVFESRELVDCGPPVEGHPPPRCRSRIEFNDSTYRWRHTDMVFVGDYTCQEGRVNAQRGSGTYDPASDVLTWQGAEYAPASN